MIRFIFVVLTLLTTTAYASNFNEDYYNDAFCEFVGGDRETRHNYTLGYIRIDCETDTRVYEGGLDKRSSLDSIQQALFASFITGKEPWVVIYDTDALEGKWELRIREAARIAGVKFIKVHADGLEVLWRGK